MLCVQLRCLHGLDQRTTSGEVGKVSLERLASRFGQVDTQDRAFAIELGIICAGVMVAEVGKQDREGREFAMDFQFDQIEQNHARRVAQTFRGTATISTHQSTSAELDPAEPARHDGNHAIKPLTVDGGGDRCADRSVDP